MNKLKALIIIISLANYLQAGEPPMQQREIGEAVRARELQRAQQQYTFDNSFLAKSTLVCALGGGLYVYGEYGMHRDASLDRESRSSAPVVAGVAAIKLLLIGCGGCMAYWQERLFGKEHAE